MKRAQRPVYRSRANSKLMRGGYKVCLAGVLLALECRAFRPERIVPRRSGHVLMGFLLDSWVLECRHFWAAEGRGGFERARERLGMSFLREAEALDARAVPRGVCFIDGRPR